KVPDSVIIASGASSRVRAFYIVSDCIYGVATQCAFGSRRCSLLLDRTRRQRRPSLSRRFRTLGLRICMSNLCAIRVARCCLRRRCRGWLRERCLLLRRWLLAARVLRWRCDGGCHLGRAFKGSTQFG